MDFLHSINHATRAHTSLLKNASAKTWKVVGNWRTRKSPLLSFSRSLSLSPSTFLQTTPTRSFFGQVRNFSATGRFCKAHPHGTSSSGRCRICPWLDVLAKPQTRNFFGQAQIWSATEKFLQSTSLFLARYIYIAKNRNSKLKVLKSSDF